MAGDLHETIVNLIQDRPELSADLLNRADPGNYPSPGPVVAENSCNEVGSRMTTERSADNVVRLTWADGYRAVVICETQGRWEDDKYFRLPGYVTRAFEDHRQDVELLLICRTDGLAARYREGIRLNRRAQIVPLALGPADFDYLKDPDAPGASAELAAVAVLLKRDSEPDQEVISTLDVLLSKIEPPRAADIANAVMALRGGAAKTILEAIMESQSLIYHSAFTEKYLKEGEAKGEVKGRLGEARSILYGLLEAAELRLSAADRKRIDECDNPKQLERWIFQVNKVSRAEELFDSAG